MNDRYAYLYLRGVEEGNYRAIRQLPKARIKTATDRRRQFNRWRLTRQLQNLSAYPSAHDEIKSGEGGQWRPDSDGDLQRQLFHPHARGKSHLAGGTELCRHARRESAYCGQRVQRKSGGRVSGRFHHHQSASRASDDNWNTGTQTGLVRTNHCCSGSER